MMLASLTNRIFLASVLLVVVVVGSTTAFVTTRVRTEAGRELRRGLMEAGAAVERRSQMLSETFVLLARLIADLPKLKAAVATGDPPTVEPLAREYRSMLRESSFVAVTDQHGRLLANVGPEALPASTLSTLASLGDARAGHEGLSFHPHESGVLQVISVPITIGREPATVAGTLSVGFVLDAALAAEFKSLTGSDVAFGLEGTIRAASVPALVWTPLASMASGSEVVHVVLDNEEYVAQARSIPLAGATAAPRRGAGPFLVVMRSQTARLRFLGPIQTFIGGAAAAAVLLSTLLSYAVARTITSPLAAITRVMRDVAATGDLTLKIPPHAGRWQDEDARLLATTFNTLTESIATFQQGAAQRERLSSLGRLSSVVAHEIRNPLMIIKAASRVLRSSDATREARREAVEDIEGEVARLNRIVSDVLDYARPLTFTWQVVDVNRVCRAAALAAGADGSSAPVALALDETLSAVVTDGDRLRSALVNVLTNARHAVAAAGGTTPAGASPGVSRSRNPGRPSVEVRTEPLPAEGVRVSVSDAGIGIDPEVLPRVFDPYFTTRPGGTGLGLAITRNIVDGLGGRISVSSDGSTGTTVRIDLPSQPPGGNGRSRRNPA